MNILYIAIGLFAFVTAASADPIPLTVTQIYQISVGISQLNAGAARVIKDGANEKQVTEPFVFSSSVRVALAIDASRVTDALAAPQKEIREATQAAMKDGKVPPEDQKSLDAAVEKITNRKVDIDLIHITEQDLALDKNTGISLATIQLLLPIFFGK
jgi:hypothetical protein